MIHNAWTVAHGDANELRKTAELLEKVTLPSIEIYKQSSNLTENEIKKMLDEETWISADEALAYGFATQVTEDEPKQSLENHFLYKLVMKNKELEKQVPKESNQEVKDPWASFFKPLKG
jgi:ATP-dependent Clp protease protease subunit